MNPSKFRSGLVSGRGGAGVFLLGLLGALPACEGGPPPAAKARPAPQAVVQKVEVRDVTVEVRAPVDVRPVLQADIASKQVGYLSTVLVDRGDVVKRGQTLATVRPSDLPDQLAAARGALAQAQAGMLVARTRRERASALAPSGVVPVQELEQATATLSQAEAAEAAARAQLDALAVRLGETRLEAPLDGVITQRRLDPGALVGPTTGTILQVAKVDTLRVFVAVRERDSAGVRIGQDACITVDALPGRRFPGKVVRVAPGFDPVTRTLDAEVYLANTEQALRPGMYGQAALRIQTRENAKVVPEGAVQLVNDQRFVFVVKTEGDKAKVVRRPVKLGFDGGTWLEIAAGLGGDEEIVTAGTDALSDGVPVRPVRGVDPYSGTAGAAGTQGKSDEKNALTGGWCTSQPASH